MSEYEYEPVPGLPERLPPGEVLLWQGVPRWQSMARHAFQARKVALYFIALMVLLLVWNLHSGKPVVTALGGVVWLAMLGAFAVGLLALLAWLMSRATLYTITSRRVVMRIGVAIQICINIPFAQVANAGLRRYADGSGDLPLTLSGPVRASYIVLWPHARPWHFSPPQPMLRAVPQAAQVAELLATALKDARGGAAEPAAAPDHASPVAPPTGA